MLYGFKKGQLVKTLVEITGMTTAGEKRTVPAGAVGVVDPKRTWPALVIEIQYIGEPAVSITYSEADGPVENFLVDVESDYKYDPQEYVAAIGPCVYVGVKSRKDFDAIHAPVEDVRDEKGSHILAKTVRNESVYVIFQHSLRSLTADAMVKRRLATLAIMESVSA